MQQQQQQQKQHEGGLEDRGIVVVGASVIPLTLAQREQLGERLRGSSRRMFGVRLLLVPGASNGAAVLCFNPQYMSCAPMTISLLPHPPVCPQHPCRE